MSGLPSGYEGYRQYEVTNPSLALTWAYAHRQAILESYTAAASSPAGGNYNPAPLEALLKIVDADITKYQMKTSRTGIARLVPCVRVDPTGQFRGIQG